VSGQLHTLAALPPENEPLVPPQRRSERGGGQNNSQLLPGLGPRIMYPVAQRYPG